ncbi:MAG: hypothetical protein K2G03_03645, partial [Bacilli bacterium]|nr:hypothetical protein [Bacilli bacterium]
MDNKARLLLIKSHALEKKNIIFIFINIFIFLAVLTTLSLLYFSITYSILTSTKDVSYKTISSHKKDEIGNWIAYDDYSFLDNNEHIVFHINSKYDGFVIDTKITNKDTELFIKPLLDSNELSNKKIGKNELICSNYIMTVNQETEEYNGIINTKKYLGKTIKYNDQSLKLTDTFSSRINFNRLNTCYVSKETYEEIGEYLEERSSETIRIDKKENINSIKSELFAKGLSVEMKYENGQINLFILISICIALIITIISFTILYNFIKKKTIYRLKRYGILKTSGYKDKDIVKLEIIENTIILATSFTISYIIFIFAYKNIIISILSEFLAGSIITYYI